jgi:O-antigen ligase
MKDRIIPILGYLLTGLILGLLLVQTSPYLVLVAILGLVFFILIFTNLDWGVTLIAIVAIIPISRQVGPVIVPLVDVVMLVILIPFILKALMYKESIKFPSINKATTILLVVMLVSLSVSSDRASTIKEIIQYMVFAYLYTTLLFNNVKSVDVVSRMMNILTIGTAVLGGYAFVRFLQIGGAGLYILGLHKNALGGLLVLPLPFLLMRYYSTKQNRWLLFISLNTLGLIVSLSRGAWLGGLAGALLVSFLIGKTKIFKTIFFLGIIGIFAYLILPTSVRDVATSSHTLNERQIYWGAAVKGFKAKPIMGWGYANFWAVSQTFNWDQPDFMQTSDPHNVYLRFAAEMGIVGLSAFAYFIYFIFTKGLKFLNKDPSSKKNYLVIGLLGSLASYFTHGFFDVFWVRGTGSLFWIFLSLIFVLMDKENLLIEAGQEKKE